MFAELFFITVFIIALNIAFGNYFYICKVRKNQPPSFLPSNQRKEIKQYLLTHKSGAIETYFLRYGFFINIVFMAAWFICGIYLIFFQ
jgi:hypothetical protein